MYHIQIDFIMVVEVVVYREEAVLSRVVTEGLVVAVVDMPRLNNMEVLVVMVWILII